MGKQYIPGEYGQAEYTEKRSRFIGQVWRVASEQEAQKYIALTREKYYDAKHNVHAFILKSGAHAVPTTVNQKAPPVCPCWKYSERAASATSVVL